MPATTLLRLDPAHWTTLLPTLIGVFCMGLALALGFLLLGRRKPSPSPGQNGLPPTTGSPSERRVSPRREGNAVEVLVVRPQSAASPEDSPLRARVLDRSLGGLCLQMDQAVQPGTLFNVRPCGASQFTPWIEVEVKHCAQQQESWRVGCRFLRTPPWGVLLLFG
jgi:hypothetical protein